MVEHINGRRPTRRYGTLRNFFNFIKVLMERNNYADGDDPIQDAPDTLGCLVEYPESDNNFDNTGIPHEDQLS